MSTLNQMFRGDSMRCLLLYDIVFYISVMLVMTFSMQYRYLKYINDDG